VAIARTLWPLQGHFDHCKDIVTIARTLWPLQGHFGHCKDIVAMATGQFGFSLAFDIFEK